MMNLPDPATESLGHCAGHRTAQSKTRGTPGRQDSNLGALAGGRQTGGGTHHE
jgi:hypothetical protein